MAVDCSTNSYAVGGTVSGVLGMGLTLQDNNGDNLAIVADGTFVFPTSVPSGQGYSVTVSAQPTNPWQSCTVSAGWAAWPAPTSRTSPSPAPPTATTWAAR